LAAAPGLDQFNIGKDCPLAEDPLRRRHPSAKFSAGTKVFLLLFLQKKKSRSFLFFSEEKNQKTFIRRCISHRAKRKPLGGVHQQSRQHQQPAPLSQIQHKNKSLFAFFSSEKEESFFLVLF
jgi:hypothetical protein